MGEAGAEGHHKPLVAHRFGKNGSNGFDVNGSRARANMQKFPLPIGGNLAQILSLKLPPPNRNKKASRRSPKGSTKGWSVRFRASLLWVTRRE